MKIANPRSGVVIEGEKITHGIELRATDKYSAPNGKWENCPSASVKLFYKAEIIWVCPSA